MAGHILVSHGLWGVYWMGSSARLVCSVAVRSVLAPAILALAWLIWGPAAAEAATVDAGPAGIAASAASDLITSPAAKPLRAAPAVPAIPNLKAPVGTTLSAVASTADSVTGTTHAVVGTVTGTANTTVGSVTGTANTVIGEAAAVVSTVTKPSAPVLAEVDKVIEVVEGVDPSVPPVVSLAGVPHPAVPTPQPGVTIPGANAGTTPAVTSSPADAPEAAAADKAQAAPSLDAGNKSKGTTPASAAAEPTLGAAGPSLAQLQMTTPHRSETAGAIQSAPLGLPHATLPQEPVASLAEGPSGSSSSGSQGSGGQAADVAGSWIGMNLRSGARTHDACQSVPAGPAFDPGSSPD